MKLRNPNAHNAWKHAVKALNVLRKRLGLSTFTFNALAALANRSGVAKGKRVSWANEWIVVYNRVEALIATDENVTAQELENAFIKDDDYRSTPSDYQRFLDDLEAIEV
jgi:hypothetical protein